MSLKTAALGWEVVSKNNNLIINMNYIGVIYIGMDNTDLNISLKESSKMALQVRRDYNSQKWINYVNEENEIIFSIQIVGNKIHRIKYKNIISLIPQNLIYTVGKKNFITNNRVDGHMIYIKSNDEIYLKEEKTIPANDISIDSKLLNTKAQGKKLAAENTKAWRGVSDTQNKYAPSMYNKSINEVEQLENKYKALVNKEYELSKKSKQLRELISRANGLHRIKVDAMQAESQYKESKEAYQSLLGKYKNDIEDLIKLGKLQNENGVIKLNENSNNTKRIKKVKTKPIYKEVTHEYAPSMMLHEDYDQYLDRRKRESHSYTQEEFVGYEDIEYYEDKIDEDYTRAEELYEKLETPRANMEKVYKNYIDSKDKFEKAEKDVETQIQTRKYNQAYNEVATVDKELQAARDQIDVLRKQLYNK